MASSLGVLAFGSIGSGELLVIFLVVLLLFGAKRIPEIARGLGKGIREFKSATRDIADEINSASRDVDSVGRIDAPRTPLSGTAPRSSSSDVEKDEAKARQQN